MRDHRETYQPGATHTRARVGFYTRENNGFSSERPIAAHPQLGRIYGIQTSKQLGSASGNFTITVKKDQEFQGPRSALRDLWREPEDVWVLIQFIVDGQTIDTMLGLVDAVNEDTQRQGSGQRSETYTIVGRDFGKVFETVELFVNLFHVPDQAIRSVGALVAAGLNNLVGTPEAFVRFLVDEWIGNNGLATQQFALPEGLGGGFFRDILQTTGVQPMRRLQHGLAINPRIIDVNQLNQGKLWDVMQEYANGTMNEMWVDLGAPPGRHSESRHTGLKPTLYLRERPFPTRSDDGHTTSAAKWHGLTTHVLERGDVVRRQIAKGGAANRYNYWLLLFDGIGTEGFNVAEILQRGVDGVEYGRPGNIPIFNEASIQAHGLRRYAAHTRFIPYQTSRRDEDQPDRENFFRLAARWLKKIHDWYSVAPLELSGRLRTSRVLPEIRVGHRIEERRHEGTIVYYCEQVSHAWTYPNSGSTTLMVTRGEYEGDDLLDYVYDSYENPPERTAREACLIPLDQELTDAEIDDYLARGCTVELPDTPLALQAFEAQLRSGQVSEGSGFTVDDPEPGGAVPRTLAAERDGTAPQQSSSGLAEGDPGTERSLSDSEPSVGSDGEIPPPGEQSPEPGSPELDRDGLERGEPIEGLDGIDAGAPDDPIGGLP